MAKREVEDEGRGAEERRKREDICSVQLAAAKRRCRCRRWDGDWLRDWPGESSFQLLVASPLSQ